MGDLEDLFNFFKDTEELKKTIRYSSCPEEVREPTAGHVWKVSFMVPILAEKFGVNVDIRHAMELANAHDLAEYKMNFDFDSYDVHRGIKTETDKDKLEKETMINIRDKFPFGYRFYDLWMEYQDCKTPEARFVRALDKLESLIHCIWTDGTGRDPKDITYLSTYADEAVKAVPELAPFLRVVKKRLRPVYEKQGAIWTKECDYPD